MTPELVSRHVAVVIDVLRATPPVIAALRATPPARALADVGLAADVTWCARRDVHDLGPRLEPDGRIRAAGGGV